MMSSIAQIDGIRTYKSIKSMDSGIYDPFYLEQSETPNASSGMNKLYLYMIAVPN